MTSTAPHQALYRRWRAQTFSQIVGQEAVVETLRNAVRTDRVSHAILFVGPRGTGKTSLARILAKAVNCTNLQDGDPCDTCEACVAVREGTTLDVLEIDAASNRGINEVRDLRDRLAYPPGAPSAQGVHPRRGPPDHARRVERAPQVAGGAARLRDLHVRVDRAVRLPAGHPVATAALRRPPADGARDRGQADPDPRSRRSSHRAGRADTDRAARGRRHARRRVDPRPAPVDDDRDRDRGRRSATCSAWPMRPRSTGSSRRSQTGDVAAGIAILDQLEERGRDPRALLDQVVDVDPRRLVDPATTDQAAPRRPSPADSSPSTPTGPASADCASSSSSPCSRGSRRLRGADAWRLRARLHRARPIAAAASGALDGPAAPRPTRPPVRGRPATAPSRPAADAQAGDDAQLRAAAARRPSRRPSAAARREPSRTPADAQPDATPDARRPRPPTNPRRPACPPSRSRSPSATTSTAWSTAGRTSSKSVSPATRAVLTECRPDRRRWQRRHARLPGGQGLPQGPRRAASQRCRDRGRRPPRPAGQRPDSSRPTSRSRRSAGGGRPRGRGAAHLRRGSGRRRRDRLSPSHTPRAHRSD